MNHKKSVAMAACALLWMGAACSEESGKPLDPMDGAMSAARSRLAWDATELRSADAKAMAADKALRLRVEAAEKRVKADEALGKKDDLARDRKALDEARSDLAKSRKAEQAALAGLRGAVRADKEVLAKAGRGKGEGAGVAWPTHEKKTPARPATPSPERLDEKVAAKKPVSGGGR
jgi:hypothetical protein